MSVTELQGIEDAFMLLKYIQNEQDLAKKLESAKALIPLLTSHPLEEKEQFYVVLMPTLNNIIEDLLTENINGLKCTVYSQMDLQTLRLNLEGSIEVLQIFSIILQDIIQHDDVALCAIKSVPRSTASALILVFGHCKNSNTVYKEYFDSLSELLDLFKKAQDLHFQLMTMLERHLKSCFTDDEELIVFTEVLNLLCDMSEILCGMNNKSFAASWKNYLKLFQKYNDALKFSEFDIHYTLQSLANSFSQNVDIVLTNEENGLQSVTLTLKLISFLVKVFVELCDIFWDTLNKNCISLLTIIVSLFRIQPSFLQHKQYSVEVISWVEENIYYFLDQMLSKLLNDDTISTKFFESYALHSCMEQNNIAFIFFATAVLEKLEVVSENTNLDVLLEAVFDCVENCFVELFWEIPVARTESTLYETLLKLMATVIINTQKDHSAIFLENVLKEDDWCAILAMDIWCLCLGHSDSRECYKTLCQLIDKFDAILKSYFTKRPQFVHLNCIISRIYSMLSDQYKVQFIEKYPPAEYMHIWRITGFKQFPLKHRFKMEDFLNFAYVTLESIANGRFTANTFVNTCQLFEALSTVEFERFGIKTTHLTVYLTQLWEFDIHNTSLLTSNLFKVFIEKLLKCSSHLVLGFSDAQLFLILTQLKHIFTISLCLKISACDLLINLSKKRFDLASDRKCIFLVSEIFNSLLKCENVIVKQKSLQAFMIFLNFTSHEEVATTAVGDSEELQDTVSSYLQSNLDKISPAEDYLMLLSKQKFTHNCLEWSSINIPKSKRFKSEDTDIERHLEKIKDHVRLLSTASERRALTERNVVDINDIVNRLQMLL